MLLSLDNVSWKAYKENGKTKVSEFQPLHQNKGTKSNQVVIKQTTKARNRHKRDREKLIMKFARTELNPKHIDEDN